MTTPSSGRSSTKRFRTSTPFEAAGRRSSRIRRGVTPRGAPHRPEQQSALPFSQLLSPLPSRPFESSASRASEDSKWSPPSATSPMATTRGRCRASAGHTRPSRRLWSFSSTVAASRGGKNSVCQPRLEQLLAVRISVAAINYPLAGRAPLPAAHCDAARALETLRSKARD